MERMGVFAADVADSCFAYVDYEEVCWGDLKVCLVTTVAMMCLLFEYGGWFFDDVKLMVIFVTYSMAVGVSECSFLALIMFVFAEKVLGHERGVL